jgi:hypothetical protein
MLNLIHIPANECTTVYNGVVSVRMLPWHRRTIQSNIRISRTLTSKRRQILRLALRLNVICCMFQCIYPWDEVAKYQSLWDDGHSVGRNRVVVVTT